MENDAAFLRAIVESPDDDTLRLVYADYLEERGDSERADFIRVQCALATMARDDPRRKELEAREAALLERNEEGRGARLAGWATVREFRRGFLEDVSASA